MADAPDNVIEIAVVLQGGGALGAYECGGVVALLEMMDGLEAAGRTVVLKSVAGVSVGAMNAACVVGARDRADVRRRIESLWDDLTIAAPKFWPSQAQRDLSLFGLPSFYWPRSDFINVSAWTSYYDTSPLRRTLERHVDFAALNASDTTYYATAVDVESGGLTTFSNHARGGRAATTIAPEHVMASGALPPQFPWITINGRHYWDGGIVDNAPLDDAINSFSHGDGITRVLIVMNLYPLRAPLPRQMSEVDDRVHQLTYGNRVRQDSAIARRFNEFIETVRELAALAPEGAINAELADRVAWASALTEVNIVDIEMQNQGDSSGQTVPLDGEFGLRDFSMKSVLRRRDAGYRLARERLASVFPSAP